MNRNELNDRLPAVVQNLAHSVGAHPKLQHLNRVYLPNREQIISSIGLLRQILFPGYFGDQGLTSANLPFRLGEIVMELTEKLYEQIRCCLRYREQIPGSDGGDERCEECDAEAAKIVATFFDRIPQVREMLAADVQAAFDSDPAAQSTDETIFCYPGLFAITVQRLAHEFYKAKCPRL